MRIEQLLEYDRNRARQALGDGLWLAAVRDHLGKTRLSSEQMRNLQNPYLDQVRLSTEQQQQLADHALAEIESADPSTNKKYTQWMARQYANGSEPKLEDVTSTLADYVDKFHRLNLKRKLPAGENDISRYKTAKQLYSVMDRYDDPLDDSDQGKADKVYEDGDVKVVIPRDQAAACAYGRQTRWCTAATKGLNYFEQYNRDGPLYILLPKSPQTQGEKYQLHFPSRSYMDQDDDPVDLGWLLTQRFPALGQWFLQNDHPGWRLRDNIAFVSDDTLQRLSDEIWEIVQPVVMNEYSQWESHDDGYHDWLRERDYVDEDGNIDWERAPGYNKYNPEAWDWVQNAEQYVHLQPADLRTAVAQANAYGNMDSWDIHDIEEALACNVLIQLRGETYDGDGLSQWISKHIRVNGNPPSAQLYSVDHRVVRENVNGRRLRDLARVSTNMPDADFWVQRSGSAKTLGRPSHSYNPDSIGIKVTATAVLDPRYLFYVFTHLHNTGAFAQQARGSFELQHLRVTDIANLPIG